MSFKVGDVVRYIGEYPPALKGLVGIIKYIDESEDLPSLDEDFPPTYAVDFTMSNFVGGGDCADGWNDTTIQGNGGYWTYADELEYNCNRTTLIYYRKEDK